MIVSLLTIAVSGSVIAGSVALYLLPVLIGWVRHVPDIWAVAVINILLGWTLLGWVAALVLALRAVSPAAPVVQLVQTLPPSPPPGELPDAGWAGPPGPPPARAASPPPLILPPHPASYEDPAQQD